MKNASDMLKDLPDGSEFLDGRVLDRLEPLVSGTTNGGLIMNVKTGKQREDDFRADFKDLLEKHGAEFELTDDGKGYGMQSPIVRITMMGVWNDDGEHLADFSEFDL